MQTFTISVQSMNEIIRWCDYLGTFAFATSGIRLAAAKRFDLFGAFTAGLATAVGGGTFRDIMLHQPIFWLRAPSYLLITIIALLLTMFFRKYLTRLNNAVSIFDAIGLGLFTTVGVACSLSAGYPWWVAPIMGTVTGVFGGIIRDVLLGESPLIFRSDFYALACLIGAFFYLGLKMAGVNQQVVQAGTALFIVTLRLLAMHYHWRVPALKP